MFSVLVSVLSLFVVPLAGHVRPARFVPPVDAPIVDHFRPPECRWCPGNRGIDYTVAPMTPIIAVEHGRVDFAGQVGGDLFVVVHHDDGLRTTYAFVASIEVVVGQQVNTGEVLAYSNESFHFGVRRGETYLDPEPFFLQRRVHARLVA
jgi:murein DD-endopeptidase MepM/ murein hydrolase activator NlpD